MDGVVLILAILTFAAIVLCPIVLPVVAAFMRSYAWFVVAAMFVAGMWAGRDSLAPAVTVWLLLWLCVRLYRGDRVGRRRVKS